MHIYIYIRLYSLYESSMAGPEACAHHGFSRAFSRGSSGEGAFEWNGFGALVMEKSWGKSWENTEDLTEIQEFTCLPCSVDIKIECIDSSPRFVQNGFWGGKRRFGIGPSPHAPIACCRRRSSSLHARAHHQKQPSRSSIAHGSLATLRSELIRYGWHGFESSGEFHG